MAGRFAPSPTGPLHLGSLVAATASYLEARKRQTAWQLRFDDLDAPRSVPGAEDAIKRALDDHALHWDGPVDYQSRHAEAYERALARLADRDLLFYCTCSRRQLQSNAPYPGTCRAHRGRRTDAAIRVRVGTTSVSFDDAIQGAQTYQLETTVGDFIVRRRDGLIAYQLATALDDGHAHIDHVVRGADLLDNTPRQLYLMDLLGLSRPEYAHVPLITHADGTKLSKQTGARAVQAEHAATNLSEALKLLGMRLPPGTQRGSCREILAWALEHWSLQRVPRVSALIGRN